MGLGAPAASLLPFVGGPLTDVISRRIFSFQRSQEEIFLLACIREKTGILTTLLVQIIFDFFQNALLPLMDGLLRHPQPMSAFPFGVVLEVIKYIIKTYINLWTENYGQLDTKQLVSSIINDEPEKMRHIANAIKINVDNLSCAYFFYLKDGSHEFICLQKMREIIKDFISVYKNTFLTDIFDDTVIVFADRRRERIDDDLPNLLHELEVRGLLCCVIINDTFETTQDVKHAYWAFQNYKKEISILFPRKRVVTGGEVSVVGRAKDNANTSSMSLADQLLTQKREADLMTTLEVYMLDADRSMQRTADYMNVHKNTIKYRLKCIEETIGHSISRMPEAYDIYLAVASIRLKRNP